MKRLVFSLCCLLSGLPLLADNGDNYFSIKAGFLFPETYNAQFSYERGLDYDTSAEVFGEIGSKFKDSHYEENYWSGGLGYKYNLKRYKNSVLKATAEVHAGAFTKSFYFGAGVGFEYNYVFKNGIQFVLQQKNQVNFRRNDVFKNGILIGLKIPL